MGHRLRMRGWMERGAKLIRRGESSNPPCRMEHGRMEG